MARIDHAAPYKSNTLINATTRIVSAINDLGTAVGYAGRHELLTSRGEMHDVYSDAAQALIDDARRKLDQAEEALRTPHRYSGDR